MSDTNISKTPDNHSEQSKPNEVQIEPLKNSDLTSKNAEHNSKPGNYTKRNKWRIRNNEKTTTNTSETDLANIKTDAGNISELYSDNIDASEGENAEEEEDILISKDSEPDIEDEYNGLTPEQQQEILKDLANSQI